MQHSLIKAALTSELLSEGVIPPHITVTLQRMVEAGVGITDDVQAYVLVQMLSFFKDSKDDEVKQWPRRLNGFEGETAVERYNAIRALSSEEQTKLAEWVLNRLDATEKFETTPCCRPGMQFRTWTDWVLNGMGPDR